MAGLEAIGSDAYMTKRERLDFAIVITVFGVLVGACVNSRSNGVDPQLK
jgi:hypothetical protein